MTDAPYDCPAVAHLSPDLTMEGYYADSKSSVVDPVKWKAYAEASAPYRRLGEEVVGAADAYRATGSRAAAQCALRQMIAAADDGVFTGKMSSRQAYYVQGWIIGAISVAYLKVRDSGQVNADDQKRLFSWFERVVKQTIDFYEKSGAKNNHLYWAGVEAAAAGIAANDRKLFAWAVETYRTGIEQIQPDGELPLEMRRGRRALHYHLYALAPLVYLAEFGRVNGLDLYAEHDRALARLERLCVAGLKDNAFFEKTAGAPQDTGNGPPGAEQISWAQIWQEHFPNPQTGALLAQASSLNYLYLGGLPPGIHAQVALRR